MQPRLQALGGGPQRGGSPVRSVLDVLVCKALVGVRIVTTSAYRGFRIRLPEQQLLVPPIR